MDVVRDFVRGAVPVHVLFHAAAGNVHGAALIEELGRHGHRLSPGTLYPMLHRLEAKGLLRSRHVVVEGRIRRVYRATPQGRAALRSCQHAVRELAGEVLGAG
jgi:DNA-binding PadR family transcriptional regulator